MLEYDTRWWVKHPKWWQVIAVVIGTVVVVLAAFALVLVGCGATVARADAGPGDHGQNVVEVQYLLRSYGYSVAVDGVFGSQTAKAVRHFQKANGLTVDSVVGPITMAALAGRPAIRIAGTGYSNTEGLRGMPFAPDGLTGCDLLIWYRVQAGLPEQFDAIGYRESRCQNEVGNYCCGGAWANYLSSHLSKNSAYRPFIINHCEVDEMSDIRGTSPLSWQKSACVTMIVYSISGMNPWRPG